MFWPSIVIVISEFLHILGLQPRISKVFSITRTIFSHSTSEQFWQQYTIVSNHGLRTPNDAFFHWNPEFLGFDRQFGQINYGAFGVFLSKLSVPILVQWTPCLCFYPSTIISTKTKPLYLHPKYLFGIGS